MIEFIDVNKSYGECPVLRDFHIEIPDGEFLTVIGSSGSGKTTFLKMINGLLQPDSGQILIDGQNIQGLDQNELRRHIGYVIQSIALFPHMQVRENISYVMKLNKLSKEQIQTRTNKLMQMVELSNTLLDRYPHELSGGQKQRVGIARALGADPNILLMDEPFGAVDEITRKSLQDMIQNLHRQTSITIVFVTHDIHEALKLADRVLVINDGQFQQCDRPEVIQQVPKTDYVKKLVQSK